MTNMYKSGFNIETQHKGFTFYAEVIHSGQYHPYGDTFRVYKITTTCTDKDIVVDFVKIFLVPDDKDVPEKSNGNYNGPAEYFRGYYTIEKIEGGFKYTKCEPYTD